MKRIKDGPGFGTSIALGDAFVFEGLAEAFAAELYPDTVPPWLKSLAGSWSLSARSCAANVAVSDCHQHVFDGADAPGASRTPRGSEQRVRRGGLAGALP